MKMDDLMPERTNTSPRSTADTVGETLDSNICESAVTRPVWDQVDGLRIHEFEYKKEKPQGGSAATRMIRVSATPRRNEMR